MRYLPALTAVLFTILVTTSGQAQVFLAPETVRDAAVIQRAQAIYGTSTVVVNPAADPSFFAAFPYHELYAVWDMPVMPTQVHFMAYNRATGMGFDVTRQFNQLLTDSGSIVATAGDAMKFARAFVVVANAELQLGRDIVTSADSSRLGVTVADPRVTGLLDGWEVRITTWAPGNGLVEDWTLRFTYAKLSRAEWRVRAIATGDFTADGGVANLGVGMVIVNRYPTSGYVLEAFQETASGPQSVKLPSDVVGTAFSTVLVERQNFDGTIWRVYYPSAGGTTIPLTVTQMATALADGAQAAYNKQVGWNVCAQVPNPNANWGFTSKDADCILEIFILDNRSVTCIACTLAGNEVKIYVAPFVKEYLNSIGYYTDPTLHDVPAIGRLVALHEHFHNLQFAISGWQPRWQGYLEGQARFIETLLAPSESQHPSSGWYVDTADYQGFIDFRICQHSYALATYWGYLYSADGGISMIKRQLEALPQVVNLECDQGLPESISIALASSPGAHNDQLAALHDMSVHAYLRDFSWGDTDGNNVQPWGLHMAPVWEVEQLSGSTTYDVGAFGIHYAGIPVGRVVSITCSGSSGWSFRLFLEDGVSPLATQPVNCATGATFDGTSLTKAHFVAIRTIPTAGTYGLGVT